MIKNKKKYLFFVFFVCNAQYISSLEFHLLNLYYIMLIFIVINPKILANNSLLLKSSIFQDGKI